VAVVSAGVHLPGFRSVGQGVFLRDIQGIHIGPQADRSARTPSLLQGPHNARFPQASMNPYPEGGKPGGNKVGGLVFLEGRFRMGVEKVPPIGHGRDSAQDVFVDLHGTSLLAS
jgi:hypothetical protein